MNKVVLIYPRFSAGNETALPPLSLLSLATFLIGRYEVRIIDQRVEQEWERELERELAEENCVCVGISTMTGPQIGAALEAAALVRSLAPELPLVWGGVHPTLLPEETLRNELVDIVVVGDGEETFAELVDVLQRGGELDGVRGILFKRGNRVVRSDPRPPFTLQKIPEAAFALAHLDRYRLPSSVTTGRCLPIVTSRGCPFRCGFCYNRRFHGRKWRALPADQTVQWVAGLKARFGITDLFLLDDNFFVDLRRVERICQGLEREKIELKIHNANCRVDTLLEMPDELLNRLHRAGFNRIYVGVESGSEKVLQHIKKEITVQQVLQANERLRNAGIHPCYSFMAGFPGETTQDLKQTLSLMNRLVAKNPGAVVYPLQFFTPFPGTDLAEESKEQGLPAPASLAEWTRYHYDRLHFPATDKTHARFLRDVHFYSRYLDPKLARGHHSPKKQLARLYSWILRKRILHGWYGWLLELWVLRWLRGIGAKPQSKPIRSQAQVRDRAVARFGSSMTASRKLARVGRHRDVLAGETGSAALADNLRLKG